MRSIPAPSFVLLFLLSLLIHAGSRARMLFIGGVFLFFSGLIYFVFMAAWLNVFRWLGEIALVTTAGRSALAMVIALINIKDYFWFRKGVSLSIPETAKPGLYQRMRGLLRADSLPALTLGTITLAIAANTYELSMYGRIPDDLHPAADPLRLDALATLRVPGASTMESTSPRLSSSR
jgi:Cu/Ag efflux pump CusA